MKKARLHSLAEPGEEAGPIGVTLRGKLEPQRNRNVALGRGRDRFVALHVNNLSNKY